MENRVSRTLVGSRQGSGRSRNSNRTGPSRCPARPQPRVVNGGKPPPNLAPPSPHLAGRAQPHSGEGAGHAAPGRRPPSEAHLGGRLTSARDTRLLRARAFSGTVPHGVLRSSPRGGAAV